MLKDLIKLGDVLVCSSGRRYVYIKCPDAGYSDKDYIVLLRCGGSYYGRGLENFSDDLVHNATHDKILRIYRPFTPLTFISTRHKIDSYNFDDWILNSTKIYPNETIINLIKYV